MINYYLALPMFIPLVTGTLGLLFKPGFNKKILFITSGIIQVLFAAFLVNLTTQNQVLFLPLGGWESPYGISITVDLLSALLVLVSTSISLVAMFYTVTEEHYSPYRLTLIQTIISGINLSFMTGDFFNLFVAFEIMLLSSYGLMTLESSEKKIRFGYSYVTINLVASTLFLCAGGLFYSLFGNLSFAGISTVSHLLVFDPRLTIMGVLLVIVFGLKAGLFPLYYWLPNSYPTLPPALGAIFGGLLTKVGVYTLLRLFGTILPHNLYSVYIFIAWLSIPTMLFGIFAALTRKTVRGVISCNIISHVGFLLMGIGIFTQASLSAVIFYMIHHMLVIAILMFITGLIIDRNGSDHFDKTGGLWEHTPLIGILFLIQALSLSGLPPFSGFWGKLLIFKSAIASNQMLLVGVATLSSILTLISMIKIWMEVFWKKKQANEILPRPANQGLKTGAIGILIAVSLYIGLFPNQLVLLTEQAGRALISQRGYRETIYSFHNLKSNKPSADSSHSAPDHPEKEHH